MFLFIITKSLSQLWFFIASDKPFGVYLLGVFTPAQWYYVYCFKSISTGFPPIYHVFLSACQSYSSF